MSGTFRKVTGSRVSRLAHNTGSTAFLFAEGLIAPFKGLPPLTTSLAMKTPPLIR
jgi:hypothetical protein